jgi:hypothetical protein
LPRLGQHLERSNRAGEGTALGGNVRLVVHQNLGQHLVDVFGGAGAAQGFLDHHASAQPDGRADGRLRDHDA